MKKILLGLISVCTIIFSCKKEHKVQPGEGQQVTHKVGFQISFSQQTAQFQTNSLKEVNSVKNNALATSSLIDSVDVIYYAVYDSVGNNIHIIKQNSSDAGFGSYNDNLHAGKYTIVVAAGKTGMILGPTTYGMGVSKLSTDIITYGYSYNSNTGVHTYNPFIEDAFYKKVTLTVTNTDSNNSITLDRITAQVVVKISDQIPAGVKYIGLIVNAGATDLFLVGTGAPVAGGGAPPVIDTLKPADIGTKNHQVSILFLPLSSTVSVQIYAKNSPDNLNIPGPYVVNTVAQKNISGVTAQANTQTILTGYLFGGNGISNPGGFNSTIDTAWNITPITKTFP
ncbi:MAG: hypothetical protein JWP37_4537 [Mucilaginibacter sp.]|nr:hypothetical protein [Mucilaginibacter sp.]